MRYVRENRRGLARAHNRAMEEVATEIVAFVDDDVIVDRHWLTAISEGFAATDDVGCVTGLIMPGEVDTPAQLLLEWHAGFAKYFGDRIFDMTVNRPDDPLFPYSAGLFGSEANMAFKTDVLRELGGFDPAIGVGTLAKPYAFARQMDIISRGGHTAMTVSELLAARSGLVPLPPRPVVITFDDGFADFVDAAAVMARQRLSSTLHVTTGALAGRGPRPELMAIPPAPMLDWSQLPEPRELRLGVTSTQCGGRFACVGTTGQLTSTTELGRSVRCVRLGYAFAIVPQFRAYWVATSSSRCPRRMSQRALTALSISAAPAPGLRPPRPQA